MARPLGGDTHVIVAGLRLRPDCYSLDVANGRPTGSRPVSEHRAADADSGPHWHVGYGADDLVLNVTLDGDFDGDLDIDAIDWRCRRDGLRTSTPGLIFLHGSEILTPHLLEHFHAGAGDVGSERCRRAFARASQATRRSGGLTRARRSTARSVLSVLVARIVVSA